MFHEKENKIVITLLEHGNEIDIFSNDTDIWKIGKQVSWNGMQFSIAPFFQRLVCTNGNTGMQLGFKSNVSNNKFNMGKIHDVLEKEITLESDTVIKNLIDSANHLMHNNISVNEFFKYKKLIDDSHVKVHNKWFDYNYLNKAYGVEVQDMPRQWQMTADSGKNAYDFFNDMTYICSHKEADITLSDYEKLKLQISSSNLLFKPILDLEQLAPVIDWQSKK
jgi:hypothetical protein